MYIIAERRDREALNKRMDPKEAVRIAICRVLLDILEDMDGFIALADCRHYYQLEEKAGLTDEDFEKSRSTSVLYSLVVLKEMHYNQKMLLALTVCDLYSGHITVPLRKRIAFETLMNAIDWPISFAEILTISRAES